MKNLFLLLFVIAFICGCTEPGLVRRTQPALGTIVEITVADQDCSRQHIQQAINSAFNEIKRIEDLLSRFNPQSDISRINASAFEHPTRVSPETISLLERSIEFSRLSEGAFDITVGPLLHLWQGREVRRQGQPHDQEINAALNKVGYQRIDIRKQEQTVYLTQTGMVLDLGGIAKGYAVDRAISALKQQGIKNALVNAGGDIYCLGRRQAEKKWQVGLEHPRKKRTLLAVLEVEDQAIVTSGDYRRPKHIINPRSGYPCAGEAASVTVLTRDCLSADALATSLFVLGPEKGIDLVNRLPHTEAAVLTQRGRGLHPVYSAGWQGNLNLTDE